MGYSGLWKNNTGNFGIFSWCLIHSWWTWVGGILILNFGWRGLSVGHAWVTFKLCLLVLLFWTLFPDDDGCVIMIFHFDKKVGGW